MEQSAKRIAKEARKARQARNARQAGKARKARKANGRLKSFFLKITTSLPSISKMIL
jgi:hypothetical protein